MRLFVGPATSRVSKDRVNALVRAYLESLAGRQTGAALVERQRAHWQKSTGHSEGPFTREDAYSGRT